MSIKAMTWVWEHAEAKGTTLLVMLALADWAGEDEGDCYPSIRRLALKSRMSETAVRNTLLHLESTGQIGIVSGAGKKTVFGATNRYFLNGYRKAQGLEAVTTQFLKRAKPKKVNPFNQVKGVQSGEGVGVQSGEGVGVQSGEPEPLSGSSVNPSYIAPAKADGGITDNSDLSTTDETLPDEPPAKTRKRSAKQLANDALVETLATAWGVPPVGRDYSVYLKVAQTLIDAGITESMFADYIEDIRRVAKSTGNWSVTIHSLTTNGRMSDYLARKAKTIQYPSNAIPRKPAAPESYRHITDADLDALVNAQVNDVIIFGAQS